MNNLIKPFTITTAAFVAGLLINKAVAAKNQSRQIDIAEKELESLQDLRMKEYEKNGKVSDETSKAISKILEKL